MKGAGLYSTSCVVTLLDAVQLRSVSGAVGSLIGVNSAVSKRTGSLHRFSAASPCKSVQLEGLLPAALHGTGQGRPGLWYASDSVTKVKRVKIAHRSRCTIENRRNIVNRNSKDWTGEILNCGEDSNPACKLT